MEGLEGVVELDDNLVELELVLNQINLVEDDDLRVDVVKHDEDGLVLNLANDYLAEEKNW